MRTIHVEELLKIRFPGQDERFAAGVEIGVLAALMASGVREIEHRIGRDNLEQARSLGRSLGYHLAGTREATVSEIVVTLRSRAVAPKLRLVRSTV